MRIGIGLFLMLCVSGCAGTPVVQYYDLQLSIGRTGDVAEPDRNLGSVRLAAVIVPDFLEDPRIFFRASRYEAGRYSYHQWIRPVSEALAEAMLIGLRASGRFFRVAGPEDRAAPGDLKFSLKVTECNEVDRQAEGETAWVSRISWQVILYDPDGKTVAESFIDEEASVEQRNALGVVTALNEALERAVSNSVDRIVSYQESASRTGE
jgi:uncharacterized lipoprotein YmbA